MDLSQLTPLRCRFGLVDPHECLDLDQLTLSGADFDKGRAPAANEIALLYTTGPAPNLFTLVPLPNSPFSDQFWTICIL
jgi:hypothetical protein